MVDVGRRIQYGHIKGVRAQYCARPKWTKSEPPLKSYTIGDRMFMGVLLILIHFYPMNIKTATFRHTSS